MEENSFADGKNSWFVGYFFSNLAGGIISPLIPLFVVLYLGLGVFYVGLTTSIISLASIPSLVAWGNLSDSIRKRKPFIMVGFLGSFLALVPISMATDLTFYLFLQILFQILAMAAVPVSTMIIIENVEKSKWPIIMSRFNLIASFGTLIGLIAGTILISVYTGSSSILIHLYEIASFVYLIAAVTTFIVIPEPGNSIARRSIHTTHSVRLSERIRFFPSTIIHFAGITRGVRGASLNSEIKAFLFATFFLMTAFQLYFVPFPVFILKSLDGTDSDVFIMFLLNSLLGTIAYRYTGKLISRFGIRNVLAGTLALRSVLFAIMSIISFIVFLHLPFITISLAFYGIMGGLWGFIGISEVSYISGMVKDNSRGKAIGYYNSLNGLGQIAGGIASAVICAEIGYGADFSIATAMVVLGAILIVRLTRDDGKKMIFPSFKRSL